MALKQDFVYTTGLKMTIEGDDDIWVFVNNKLAIDLGGIHTTKTDSVSLDAVATQLGLEAGKQYSITVFFVERQGESSSLSISTNIFKLDTTTGAIKLCAMPDTIVERRPLLTWYKPQQTVPGYTVQISRSSLFTDMVVNDLASDTFYQCKTDLPLFRLYWRVKADSVGTSNIGTFYIRDQRVPVLIPYESPTANRRPVLCWYKPPVPVTGYTLQLSLTIAFAELLVNVQVADTFFACTTDVPINTIYWRVQADSSEFSAPGSFIVKDGRIPIIIPYTPKLTKEKTPILRWKKVENATGYVINIDTTPTFTTLIVNQPVSDVQFVSSVPLPIKKIYWRVKSDLIETWSDVDWFIILPDTIPFLIRYNGETVTTGSPQFKWNPVTGAAPYQLMLADNREFANAFKIPSNDTVYTSPIALKNGTWYWKVSCSKNLGAYPPMDSVVINVVGSQDQSTNNVRPGIVLSAINNSIRIAVQGFKVLPDQVQAAVYDIRGKQIALLQHNGVADPVFIWNYRQNSVPAGAYFLRITAGQRVVVNKIVLNR
jgi:fibro-slime domain-containing protein